MHIRHLILPYQKIKNNEILLNLKFPKTKITSELQIIDEFLELVKELGEKLILEWAKKVRDENGCEN